MKNSKNINQASVTEQHLPAKYSFLDVLMLLNCLITKEALELNRKCFMATLDSMQYLARQGIPLREHGSDEDSNFFLLLIMKSKEFPELKA